MEYYNYLVKLLKTSICCKDNSSHHQEYSFGTISLSNHSRKNSLFQSFQEIPYDNITKNQTGKKAKITEMLETNINTQGFESLDNSIIYPDDNNQNIWEAVDNNDVEFIQSCIFSQDISNLEDSNGFTLLHRGVIAGNVEITEILASKLNVSAKDRLNRTPLHYAYMRKSTLIIKELLKHGARISDLDVYGKTPSEYAPENEEITELTTKSYDFRNVMNSISKDMVSTIDGNTKSIEKIIEVDEEDTGRQEMDRKKTIPSGNTKYRRLTGPKEDTIKIKSFHDYHIVKVLGASPYGEVYLVRDTRTKQLYTMKVFKKQKIVSENILKIAVFEKDLLKNLNHPFIIPLICTFQSNENLMLVSHYCQRGTIASQIGCKVPIKIDMIRLYASEIITAIEYIHNKGYSYRALNPKSILINEDGHIMLSNFQMAKKGILKDTQKTLKGNIIYFPPEVIKGDPYNIEVDWYMFGLVLYEMATCRPYYYEEKFGNVPDKSLEDLIKKLLDPVPLKRLGFYEDSKQIKSHYFFSTINWNMVINKEYRMPLPELTDTDPQFVELHVSEDEEFDKDLEIQDWSFVFPV
ncbi:hypothetical protein SteCoe_37733 [Stentor coeruleus]|uniref:Protein kinase domain-containing protein n=1 Tax=Stentor coeruleus TaxID=5963 RepID=A0A1R2AMH7_9CILI|nr:hypothetical protein SteCoe_37733 [Stentor coeruleus]